MDCYRRDWLKSDLSVDFISFGISKQSEIVEETEKLGRQIGIVGDLRVGIFVERSSNLFAVTLREVDDVRAGGRKLNQRPRTSVPQLRLYAALLLHTAISLPPQLWTRRHALTVYTIILTSFLLFFHQSYLNIKSYQIKNHLLLKSFFV